MKPNDWIVLALGIALVGTWGIFYRHLIVDDSVQQYTNLDYWSCRDQLNTEASRADKAERARAYYRRAALLGER